MSTRKDESVFSYSLSRPYPFRWFTYVVAIVGTICAVLFTFVALAADGYNLDLEYTLNLNSTLNELYWFQKAPFSWVSKTSASCQPALLTTGSTYFTSNLGFSYVLDALWREGLHETQNRILPATAYENALLEDCRVPLIEIDFVRNDQTMNEKNWWTWASTTASATVTCSFQTSSGGVKANFTTQLPPVSQLPNTASKSLVLSANISEHANIWFGAQLAAAWYEQLPPAMSFQQIPQYPTTARSTWDSGNVRLYPNPDVDKFTDLEFFRCSVVFYSNTGGISFTDPPHTIANWADPSKNGGLKGYHLPNITTTLDTFAKSLYSLVLSDFGVADETNALVTPSGVKWLQSQVDLELRGQKNSILGGTWSGRPGNIQNAINQTGPPYPVNQAYQSVVDALGAPPDLNNTRTSTIFMQYLCSIPKRKGGGALFFAVLLADLVFLQAVWALLNLGATQWLQHKYEQANYCDGCRAMGIAALKRKVSEYELLQVNPRGSSGVSLQVGEPFQRGVHSIDRSGRADGTSEI